MSRYFVDLILSLFYYGSLVYFLFIEFSYIYFKMKKDTRFYNVSFFRYLYEPIKTLKKGDN